MLADTSENTQNSSNGSVSNVSTTKSKGKEQSSGFEGLYGVFPYSVEESVFERPSILIAGLFAALSDRKFHASALPRMELALEYREKFELIIRIRAAMRTAPTGSDSRALSQAYNKLTYTEELISKNFPFVAEPIWPEDGEDYVREVIQTRLDSLSRGLGTGEAEKEILQTKRYLQSEPIRGNGKEAIVRFLLWKIYLERASKNKALIRESAQFD